MTDSNGRAFISFDEALELLPDSDTIHTYRAAGSALFGADWDKADIIAALRKGEPELTGPLASAMGHGLAVHDYLGALFIETKHKAVAE